MKLQAKSRLRAFAPPHDLTVVIRDRMVPLLKKVGLVAQPQNDEDNVYPTLLYFEFESESWTMSLGEVLSGKALVYVTTPGEVTNEALRHFTRNKDWSKVEATNEMVKRCLAKLKETGLKFELESPNVIHKLVTIMGQYPVPKELKR